MFQKSRDDAFDGPVAHRSSDAEVDDVAAVDERCPSSRTDMSGGR